MSKSRVNDNLNVQKPFTKGKKIVSCVNCYHKYIYHKTIKNLKTYEPNCEKKVIHRYPYSGLIASWLVVRQKSLSLSILSQCFTWRKWLPFFSPWHDKWQGKFNECKSFNQATPEWRAPIMCSFPHTNHAHIPLFANYQWITTSSQQKKPPIVGQQTAPVPSATPMTSIVVWGHTGSRGVTLWSHSCDPHTCVLREWRCLFSSDVMRAGVAMHLMHGMVPSGAAGEILCFCGCLTSSDIWSVAFMSVSMYFIMRLSTSKW